MLNLIKNAMLLSAHHVAKETAKTLEEELRKDDKDEKKYKRKMLVVGIVHKLLGTLYNE
ncbi:MAG: hypothetical protein JWO03_1887 [Bacteroidetes bacterium]|nr:hypothetical protein [Bacteroidota bacterium]